MTLSRSILKVFVSVTLFALVTGSWGLAGPHATTAGQPEPQARAVRPASVPVLARFAGQPAVRAHEWVLVANHLHSAPGGSNGWNTGVKHILEFCSKRNIEFAIFTEHNSISTWFLSNFRPSGRCTPIGGEEWTSDAGHANLIGFKATRPEDAILPCNSKGQGAAGPLARGLPDCGPSGRQDYEGMMAAAHSRGGIVIINHPVLSHYQWPDQAFQADAVEINRTWSDKSGEKARAWWHRQLLAGVRLPAVGGSDYHYFRPLKLDDGDDVQPDDSSPWSPDIDTPINLVRVSEKTVPAVLAALKAGHVQVMRDLEQPRVFIGCDVNGDGDFDDYMMGDKVRMEPGKPVLFQVRVLNGKGHVLHLLDARVGDGPAQTRDEKVQVLTDDFVLPVTRPATEAKDRFLRTEIGDQGANVTNPIYY